MVKALFSILIIAYLIPNVAKATTYAAYRTWAEGTARVLSMAGAFAAVGDDASNVWISPAMIPLTNSGLDVIFTQGQAFSTDYNSLFTDQNQETFRSSFDSTTATFVFSDQLSIGIGDGDPFSEGPDNPSFGNSYLQYHETRFSVGTTIKKEVGLAATLIYRFMAERYQGYSGGNQSQEQDSPALDLNLSAAWDLHEHWIFSGSWEQGQDFNLQNPAGLVPAGIGIQPVRIPTLTRMGVSRKWPEIKLLLSSELDLWTSAANLSGFIDSQNTSQETQSVDNTVVVPRIAIEHEFLERTWIRSWVRAGYYEEPPRVQQDRERDHVTLGVESKLWILDFNFAFDHASGYSNAATSLGISLSDYL